LTPSRSYRRGYPVALLVGIGANQAVLWKVFSHVVKPERTVSLAGTRSDAKALYNFHEAIVNAIRPTIREGTKSIIVASPPRTSFTSELLSHIQSHHSWLTQGGERATFAEIVGSATTPHEVTVLTRTPEFRSIVGETTTQETENLLELLEKNLNATSPEPLVLYSLEEIEDKILGTWLPGKPKPDYLMLADTYLSGTRQRGRLQRLIQVAANRKVKSRIVKADSPAGKRLLQLGGMVCILRQT
jgi:stalled ribosome rescue protein Dom34